MKRERYYVHPQTAEILSERDDHTIAFEIEATETELVELRNLLMELRDGENSTFYTALLPFQQEEAQVENAEYDQHLNEIYRKIYQLGTLQTKKELSQIQPELFLPPFTSD